MVSLSPEHSWMILEASRALDERQTDDFIDNVVRSLAQNGEPTTDKVRSAIAAARKALRRSEAQ
jgi:hypothetical protein